MSNKVLFIDTSTHLAHWGTKGQKWGIRNWQNYDGTFTEAGKERYFGQKPKRGDNHAAYLSDETLRKTVNRINAERNYTNAARSRYATSAAINAKKASAVFDTVSKTTNAAGNIVRLASNARKMAGNSGDDVSNKLASATATLTVLKTFSDFLKKQSDKKTNEIDNTRLIRDLDSLSDSDLAAATNRINLENAYNSYIDSALGKTGREKVMDVVDTIGGVSASFADVFNKINEANDKAKKASNANNNDGSGGKNKSDKDSNKKSDDSKKDKEKSKTSKNENGQKTDNKPIKEDASSKKPKDKNPSSKKDSEDSAKESNNNKSNKESETSTINKRIDDFLGVRLNTDVYYSNNRLEEAKAAYTKLNKAISRISDDVDGLPDEVRYSLSHELWESSNNLYAKAPEPFFEDFLNMTNTEAESWAIRNADEIAEAATNLERNATKIINEYRVTHSGISVESKRVLFIDTSTHLVHYGTKGQKWGVRNYQNYDGTYTEVGKERYFADSGSYSSSATTSSGSGSLASGVSSGILENKEDVDKFYEQLPQEELDKLKKRLYGNAGHSVTITKELLVEMNDLAQKYAKHSDNSTRVLFIDESEHLAHFGTKGMKWGDRHWQNYDGTFTEAGKERYFGDRKERNRFRSQAIKKTGYKSTVGVPDSVDKWRKESVNKILSSRTSKKVDDLRRKANPDFAEDVVYTMLGDTDFDMIDALMMDYEPTREQFIDCQMSYALESATDCLFAGMNYSDEIKALKVSEVNKLKNVEQYSDAGKQVVYDVLNNSAHASDGPDSKTLMDDYKRFFLSGYKAIYDVVPELLDVLPSPGKSDGMSFDERISKLDDLINKNYDAIRQQIEKDVDAIAKDTGLNGYESWNKTRETKEPPHGLPGMHWGPRAYNYDDANKKN